MFSAENEYTPKRFSLLRHIVCPSDEISLNHHWPELDCLAVAAEIAEIMQIAPYTSKIKRYKENIGPPMREISGEIKTTMDGYDRQSLTVMITKHLSMITPNTCSTSVSVSMIIKHLSMKK
jgi:hypothetical protein